MAILRSQKSNYDCGPTCFANALNLLGYDIKTQKANKLCRLTQDGTDSDDIAKAFDRYGFKIKEHSFYDVKKAWKWMESNTKKGTPVIISTDNDTHWVLILNASNKFAQILDPEENYPIKISKRELLNIWGSDIKNSRKFYGIRMIPFKNKSIKAVLMREQLIATSCV